jgi:protein-tyrosine-phosphatase
VDLARIWQEQSARVKRLFAERRERKAQRQAWQSGEVSQRLSQAKQILFICYGNINRSALAERCFAGMAPNAGVKAISAGFHHEANRPADPVMVEVASAAKVDLQNWASHRLDATMATGSDIIFVMEQKHLQQLQHAFPQAASKTFLLNAGPMVGGTPEIADPYGKERAVYERVCQQVTECVEHIAKQLH